MGIVTRIKVGTKIKTPANMVCIFEEILLFPAPGN